MERFEVFTLGKHFLHVHTEKGFTLYANAKLVNGQLTSYTDKMVRRGGSWVIDVWRFLNKKDFPVNPIYTAVFGFDSEDTAVQVTATDIDVESISGVNGQLVDIGNISLPVGQSLSVNNFYGKEINAIKLEYDLNGIPLNFPDISEFKLFSVSGIFTETTRTSNLYYDSESGVATYMEGTKTYSGKAAFKFFQCNHITGNYTLNITIVGGATGTVDVPFNISTLRKYHVILFFRNADSVLQVTC